MLPPRQAGDWGRLIHDPTGDIDKGPGLAPFADDLCPPRRVPRVVVAVVRWSSLLVARHARRPISFFSRAAPIQCKPPPEPRPVLTSIQNTTVFRRDQVATCA